MRPAVGQRGREAVAQEMFAFSSASRTTEAPISGALSNQVNGNDAEHGPWWRAGRGRGRDEEKETIVRERRPGGRGPARAAAGRRAVRGRRPRYSITSLVSIS
ncbi:hypothetical protein EVAR_6176_1 [Eumeta japonica]|uniref:Uncharacterized protein n=1 Tax=Eumeta variegata TaxID=151549 RepID=A0A4C1THG4_EUMVA|nr:hypothetical protein EVAR_6176_1 [Eumeta japonica]